MDLDRMNLDVQLVVLVKEEAPEEQSAAVDQQDPEHLHIKEEQEELWTSLEGEQLHLKEETDATRFPFDAVSIKIEDDDDPPYSQLHQQQPEDMDVPTSSSVDQMTAETGGGAETSGDPDQNSHEQSSQLKSFNCDDCGKICSTKSNLNSHMRVHTGQRPYACEFCRQRFGCKSNLNRHMRVHTGQKPYACEFCGLRFGQNAHLNRHMRVHTGQKPYECEFCGQTFSQKSSLNRHISVHTGL